jgi:hypothetical protein
MSRISLLGRDDVAGAHEARPYKTGERDEMREARRNGGSTKHL